MIPSSLARSVWRTVASLRGALFRGVLLIALPAGAAEVLPLNSDPGPTPGDLFQGAVIDAAPSTPALSGFDRRDAFGTQFSTGEPGRVVLADNLGTAVQTLYFHTAAPVTLTGYKLYLGSDSSGRGASSVELAMTDAVFGPGTVLSTVNLSSPYPSNVGTNSIRHILVSGNFAPETGQFFVLRVTPATSNSGVRVIELDGVAPTGVLAATHVDFSTAGYVPPTPGPPAVPSPQTPVNGFTYGYYETANVTSGTFGTSIMSPIGNEWHGLEAFQTPSHYPYMTHPGASSSYERPSVRRYSVGSGGEFPYTGPVRLVGRFFRQGSGATTRFVTVNGLTVYTRPASTDDDDFDLTVNAELGSMIDFGIATGASSAGDTTGLVAWIATGDAATPTNIVTNAYNTPTIRSECFALATDGVIGGTDATSFDTAPGTGFPYQFAGLLYLENSGSGKATRFDAVSIDLTTSADFSDTPRLYVLRHNSDTASSNPALDDRYVRMPIIPVRTASNSAGQPAYTFDLTSLSAAERTGYGFAVVGAGMYQGTSISISELSATAVRVADTAVITPQPFLVPGPNGHRYGLSVVRGDWEQAEASAVIADGHLVTINTSAENAFLLTQFGGGHYIGLKQDGVDAATEPAGGWRWRTGELLSTSGAYTSWAPNEPNGGEGPEEDYGFLDAGGTWGDVLVGGYPPALRNTFRGIVEVEASNTDKTFYLPSISAKSNIFDAGLSTPTQGGVLPPSIDLTGLAGQVVTFPQIVGVLNTATDLHGPDGRHTAGRSCDLTSVGGISGYLNGNNTPALLGVFLAATQPGSAPARLDFSTSALGEDFVTLAPQLGQVFFIGDGATSGGITQQFTIPAGATRLYFGVPDGNSGPSNDNATLYHGTPLGYGDNSGTMSLRAFVAPDSTPVAEPDIAVEQPAGVALVAGANTVDFGRAQTNTPVVRTFTIRNTGTAELRDLAATIDGDEGGEFVEGEFGATTLATAGPEASTTLSLTFTPAATGTRTAVLHITSNDSNESPFDVLLNGEGVNLQVTFSAASGPLVISGGTGPYLVTLVNGSLPQGLTIAASDPDANGKSNNWLVSGTAGDGAYSFTLRVTDSLGTSADRTFSGVVDNVPTPIELPLTANPGPTPGDLFQGAVIDSPPSTGARPGFSLGDMFGGQISTVEVGTAVIEDNHGTAIQNVFFHTAAPVTLSSIKLYLAEDAAGGRGASRIELAVTNANFTLNDVISTIDLASPYPVAAGEANLRRMLVTDSFAPVTAQYFVLHLTPSTPNSGVRVLELDGVAPTGILAASHVDFSHAAGSTGTPPAQTAVNGFTYGYYETANSTAGTFSTASMAVSFPPDDPGDLKWHGTDTYGTPIHGPIETHPGTTLRPSVRRYTVGSGGEHAYSGSVRIAGLFFRQGAGLTNRFVTVDGVPEYTSNGSAGDDAFDLTVNVAPNSTIDFGVAPGADPNFDTTGMIAWIGASDAAIPTNIVASAYNSPANDRGGCFAIGTDGVVGATDATSFDTAPGTGSPNEFAGLIYLENAGSGKATRFDSVRIDETTSGFAEPPRLYLLVQNSDPASSNPAADARYVLLPVTPVRGSANTAGQPFYTFDLSSLTASQRTGYGFAIAGSGNYTGGAIAVSEISVAAMRVSNADPAGNAIFGWGDGAAMAIGDGTTTVRHTPVPTIMTGALAGKAVASVVAGSGRSFALTTDHKVFGWGGGVGDGTTTTRPEPVAVAMTEPVTAIATGWGQTLALTLDGEVYSWGSNSLGELGLGDTTPRHSPVKVQGALSGKTVIAISAGPTHSMALTSTGELYAWGANGYGQLGDGGTTNRLSPVAIVFTGTLLEGLVITSILCSYDHTVVLTSEGLVFSWGHNGNAALGDGTFVDRLTPVAVNGALAGRRVEAISGGSIHHLALASDGFVYAWGTNIAGCLGDGTATTRPSPVAVDRTGVLAGKAIASVHAGSYSSLVRTKDHQLFSWGWNNYGQLGVGNATIQSYVPIAVDMPEALAGKTLIACSMEVLHALVIVRAPEIAIETSDGIGLVDNANFLDAGTALSGNSTQMTVTIRNTGPVTLNGLAVSRSGTHEADFAISGPALASLAPGAPTTFTITFSPAATGARVAMIHIASDDVDENPFDVALMGTGGVPIAEWRQLHFGTAANSGDAADDADFDDDGLLNLIEFGTGTDPNGANASGEPLLPPLAGVLTFRYTRSRQAMAELTFQVQWSDELTDWNINGINETILSDDGVFQEVEATVPAGNGGSRFVQLQVTRP